MNAKTLEAITRHGNTLLSIFPDASEKDPVALCKKLRRIESFASQKATDYCNGIIDSQGWEAASEKAKSRVWSLLGGERVCQSAGFFINGDPRGYALKLDDAFVRGFNRTTSGPCLHSDWGGYGILAPEISA